VSEQGTKLTGIARPCDVDDVGPELLERSSHQRVVPPYQQVAGKVVFERQLCPTTFEHQPLRG
jgi:hypothetical protein